MIPLELSCELNTPDSEEKVENPLEIESVEDPDEVRSEIASSVDEDEVPEVRPSRRTAQASRAQIRNLAAQGLL